MNKIIYFKSSVFVFLIIIFWVHCLGALDQINPAEGRWLELNGTNIYYAEDNASLDIGDEQYESITVELWLSFSKVPAHSVVLLSKAKAYKMEFKEKTITWETPNRKAHVFSFTIFSIYKGLLRSAETYFLYEPVPGDLIHLVGAYECRTNIISLCINGEYYSQATVFDNFYASDAQLVIGGQLPYTSPSEDFRLKIDEVRISDIVRYKKKFPPVYAPFEPDKNTRALYHFNEQNPPYADASGNGNTLIRWFEIVPQSWDVNKDKKVDITDLNIVKQNFGQIITKPKNPNPDVNGDGLVDILDLVLVCQHFGEKY
jgi:hypothetical protein